MSAFLSDSRPTVAALTDLAAKPNPAAPKPPLPKDQAPKAPAAPPPSQAPQPAPPPKPAAPPAQPAAPAAPPAQPMAPNPNPAGQPAQPPQGMPGMTAPGQQAIQPQSLKELAIFAGKLVAAAEGVEALDPNQAVARLLNDGSLGVKIPLGQQPFVSLDTLAEVGKDLSKNLFGYLKVIGLGLFTKVVDLRVQTASSTTNSNVAAGAPGGFIIAFNLQP